MSRVVSFTALLAALAAGPTAQAQGLVDEVRACRQLSDVPRRVACYDAMKLPGSQGAAATVSAPAAAPVAVDPVAKFGQESVRSTTGTPDLKRIDSRIRGKFEGWRPNKLLELENGQVWRIADDSEALYQLQDPKVTVHRGLLGAFFLEIEGVPFMARVVRAR